MHCSNCGAPLDSQAKFCSHCGVGIEVKAAAHIIEREESKWDSPFWFRLLIVIVFSMSLLALAMTFFASDLTDTVLDHLHALKEGRATEAYYNFTSLAFQEATPLEQFHHFVKKYPVFAQNHSVRFIDRQVDNEIGRLETLLSKPDRLETRLQYHLIKQEGAWKIFSIQMESQGDQHPHLQLQNQNEQDLIDPVEYQLKAFRKKDFSHGYEMVSKQFAEQTSIDQFINYVKSHPIFFQHTFVSYADLQQEGGKGVLQATLHAPNDQAIILYALVKEDGSWKIWSLHLEKTSAKQSRVSDKAFQSDEFNPQPIYEAVENWFQLLHKKNWSQAYDKYTAKDFQKATSFTEFQKFVEAQPTFSEDAQMHLSHLTFDNNVAAITGTLTSPEGTGYRVVFDLVEEEEKWKILHIDLFDLDNRPKNQNLSPIESLKFTELNIGTEVDAKGMVENPLKNLKTTSGEIYLNVHVANALAGTTVEIALQHVDSNSTIPSLSTQTPRDGKNLLSFVFLPPKDGWLEGEYVITAKTLEGTQKTLKFQVD